MNCSFDKYIGHAIHQHRPPDILGFSLWVILNEQNEK
jgi:hypothetical protein